MKKILKIVTLCLCFVLLISTMFIPKVDASTMAGDIHFIDIPWENLIMYNSWIPVDESEANVYLDSFYTFSDDIYFDRYGLDNYNGMQTYTFYSEDLDLDASTYRYSYNFDEGSYLTSLQLVYRDIYLTNFNDKLDYNTIGLSIPGEDEYSIHYYGRILLGDGGYLSFDEYETIASAQSFKIIPDNANNENFYIDNLTITIQLDGIDMTDAVIYFTNTFSNGRHYLSNEFFSNYYEGIPDVGNWLLRSLNSFLSFELVPGFTLLSLLGLICVIPVAIWLFKMVLGG